MLEQDHAGAQAFDELDAVGDAGRGPDRHEAGLGTQEHRQPGPDGRLGIDDGDPSHGVDPSKRG
jgi:hypothetical protein